MIPSDMFAFYEPSIAIPLALVGVLFGSFVLWHYPSARMGWRPMLFLLAVADFIPWIYIIAFRGIEYTGGGGQFAKWYQSFGTLAMFIGFDVGAAAGIAVRDRIHVWNAKRHAVLPHGVHHTR